MAGGQEGPAIQTGGRTAVQIGRALFESKLLPEKGVTNSIRALGSALPAQGLPGPSGPEPRKSPKRVPKESPGAGPQGPRRVRPGVSKESEKSPKVRVLDSFRTLLRLRGALFADRGGPPRATLSGLFNFGLFQGFGPEGPGRPCAGRGRS